MKKITKKYLLFISIFTCLIIGALVTKSIISRFNSSAVSLTSSIESAYMARNILEYTQRAVIIIIGEVKEVSGPYIVENGTIAHQDVVIDISEVLKGDPNMNKITLLIDDGYAVVKSEKGDISFIPQERENIYKPGEKILLFVGKTMGNDYVPFAGPFGKYLIDENNNVTSIGDFKMSLKKLKTEIQEALKLPLKEHVVIPVEKMY